MTTSNDGHAHRAAHVIKCGRESSVGSTQNERRFVSYVRGGVGFTHDVHRKKRILAFSRNDVPPAFDHEPRTGGSIEYSISLP